METLTAICMIISVVAFVISIIVGIIGIMAFVELRSFMKSTHKVQFVPFDGQENSPTQSNEKDPTNYDELERFDLI